MVDDSASEIGEKGACGMAQKFDIDTKGLAKLVARRGMGHIVHELWQNAADEAGVTTIQLTIEPVPNTPEIMVKVEDDAPEGFKDLSHAYTLFAESSKKNDPQKRGRFNLGEKLVIAICRKAVISTTKGTVQFDDKGRHHTKEKRERGTVFAGLMRATRKQMEEMIVAAANLIVPPTIRTILNGIPIESRTPLTTIEASLPTLISDDDGVLRPVTRKTQIDIYEPRQGETPSIYEMGIPVVETGDKYHIDVRQKVPMSLERDNVTPSYLQTLRVLVMNATFSRLSTEDCNQVWAKAAVGDSRVADDAVRTSATLRFGEKRVSFDPSDVEANSTASYQGYTVVHGRSCSAGEWDNMRRAGAIQAAGQVMPTPKPYGQGGKPEEIIPSSDWTDDMHRMARYCVLLGKRLMNLNIVVKMTKAGDNFSACYGQRMITFNLTVLKQSWFEGNFGVAHDELIIHEFGHEYAADHRSPEYHDAICKLGAKLANLFLEQPEMVREERLAPSKEPVDSL